MSVRIIEPVLFPITVDELDVLRLSGKYGLKDVDILLNYNYQLIHYNLLIAYVDPALQTSCIDFLKNTREYEDIFTFIDEVSTKLIENVYKDYYLLFLCNFIKEVNPSHKFMEKFKIWLNIPHDYTYKMSSKPRLIFKLKRYYNTMIIPKLWNDNKGNLLNTVHDFPINYFNQRNTLKEAGDHLIDGGRYYLMNDSDFGEMLCSLEGDYDEIEKNVFEKKQTPKNINIKIGKENKL